MIQLLDTSWYCRRQIVPCLVGPPGIGKTAAVEEHAAKHDAKVIKIVASRCVPSETVGMTMPNNQDRSMDIYNSRQLSCLKDGDILFLDELLEADQFVLSTLLTVIESREMADGTPLPDIQIIAATNSTISPEQLRGNIRQRFMFMRFSADPYGTRKYIYQKTGVWLPEEITVRATESETSRDYNFLTPRTLTKLVMWIDSQPTKEMQTHTANIIDKMWKFPLGSKINAAIAARDVPKSTPEEQVKSTVLDMVAEGVLDEFPDLEKLKNYSMAELLQFLMKQPNWNKIKNRLEHVHIYEEIGVNQEVDF